jgi:hypothetical protein
MSEFTKESTVSSSAQFASTFLTASSGSGSRGRKPTAERRASTSFISPSVQDNFGFTNAFAEDPFGSASDERSSKIHSSSKKGTRRSSIAGAGMTRSSFSSDPFASLEDTTTKPTKHRPSRRHSAHCAAPKSKRTEAGFAGSFEAEGFANFDSMDPFTSDSVAFDAFSEQNSKPRRRFKENPLLSIPDPLAEQRALQEQEEDFFANMPDPKGMDGEESLHASRGFLDEASVDDDFSEDGTILWEAGGSIVSKNEKYGGNRSNGTLNSSGSLLNTSQGNLRQSSRSINSRASRRSYSGRKRLDTLDRHGRGCEDELTTATPSTRFSTDSEFSSNTMPTRRSSLNSSIELKTGSLLGDLVLIMDGKKQAEGGAGEKNKRRGQRTHRSGASIQSDIPDRPSRRRSCTADSNVDEPFVVKRDARGVNMGSFSSLGSRSSFSTTDRPRRSSRRTKSFDGQGF